MVMAAAALRVATHSEGERGIEERIVRGEVR
jgi:hypothetical protein